MIKPPTYQGVLDKQWIRTIGGDVLSLGEYADGDLEITESSREDQMYIVGAPGGGKSRFVEHLLRHDIDRLKADEHKEKNDRKSCGVCVIDPSAGFDLGRKILAYCAKINFKNVFAFDPELVDQNKVAPLNIFDFSLPAQKDTFRVLFSVADPAGTAFIETYLPALLRVLKVGGYTLADADCFAALPRKEAFDEYALQRAEIFERAEHARPKDVHNLRFVYSNYTIFSKEIASSVRRFTPVLEDERLAMMLSYRDGVNFDRLISEGWVCLVNASTTMDVMPARFLATAVINGVLESLGTLHKRGFTKPYYLYIDDAGRYATRKIADSLENMRKTGLRVILANQYPTQFEDKRVFDAVHNACKIKVAFYVVNPKEREIMAQMLGYGGQFKYTELAHELGDQRKQYMVVKLPRRHPVMARVYDVSDLKENKVFINQLLNRPGTYYDLTKDSDRPKLRGQPVSKAAHKAHISDLVARGKNVSDSKQEPPAVESIWPGPGQELRSRQGKAVANKEKRSSPKARPKKPR